MHIFSGIRPTGEIHLGNYFGAIKQWVEFQEKNECIFCIVDLHAITTPYEPKELQKNILETAIIYLAAGVNPEKSIIFVQSHVKEHAELCWLLNTITPVGELQRMTQFKEKAKKHPEYVNAGLLNYPVLMAADILLYKAEAVPVGKDQSQHVELARTLAKRFNQKFGKIFLEPKVILPKLGSKIMSLADPKKKMSKTDSPNSYISLFDEPEEIQKKIMAATTDSGKIIKYDPLKKPGISNLLTIYSLLTNAPLKEIERKFKNKGYAEFKKATAKTIIDFLEPFRKKRKELSRRDVYIKEILNQGKGQAERIAKSTMTEVYSKMGLS